MSRRPSRFGLLFIGVFIGILAGILLALWLNNSGWSFSKLSSFFSSDKEPRTSRVSQRVADPEKLAFIQKKKPNKYLHNKFDSLSSNTDSLSLDEFLAYYRDEYPDSVLIDAYYLNAENKARDVDVAKDELIYSKQVQVSGISGEKENNRLDSLLLDDRGMKNAGKDVVQVEIWRSPINYQGYKWDGRRLVLFGFYESEYIKIKTLDGNYFMQYGTLYYRLDLSNNFKPLSLLDDRDLVEKLNGL